tara:strand:- start:5281 stop:5487 length:207 start_codon:yes stop_codon:yes gene_type:complete
LIGRATLIRTILTDQQWNLIAPHCLGKETDVGRTGPDPRLFVEAVLWIARTGAPLSAALCLPAGQRMA